MAEIMENTDFYKNLLDYLDEGVLLVDLKGRITSGNESVKNISGYKAEELVGKPYTEIIFTQITDPDPDYDPDLSNIVDASSTMDAYLHHQEGFLLPVKFSVAPITNDTGEVAGEVLILGDNSSEIASFQRIKELEGPDCLDPLTGVARRKHLEIFIQSRLDELRRYNWPFGILFFDLDHLQRINFLHGHEIGDRILKVVAKTLTKNTKSFDLVARWGGQEFILVIANTNKSYLPNIAEKYRKLIGYSKLISDDDKAISITVSIGAAIAGEDDSLASIIEKGKQAMIESKSRGRNCVTI